MIVDAKALSVNRRAARVCKNRRPLAAANAANCIQVELALENGQNPRKNRKDANESAKGRQISLAPFDFGEFLRF
jgi:hypothetical protein